MGKGEMRAFDLNAYLGNHQLAFIPKKLWTPKSVATAIWRAYRLGRKHEREGRRVKR